MFKKKRNTIVELVRVEAQRIAEREAARAVRAQKADEVAAKRRARDRETLDRRIRQIADVAVDDAAEALAVARRMAPASHNVEAAGVAAAVAREEPSGPRSRSDVIRPGRVTHARAGIPLREALRRLEAGEGPLSVEFVELPLQENGELHAGVDGAHCVADDLPLVPDCFKEVRVSGVVDVELSQVSGAARKVRCGDVPDDKSKLVGVARCDHVSSPVVAESEADTSDAPAMTVQEGGGSTAAPDLGAGTVSVFRSRFVVAGRYVYDRDLNKVIDGVALSFGADVLVEMLNAGHADARAYSWEDAK